MSWLTDYLAYTETQESPERFHLWCGIACVAATVNRKVWLPRISRDGIERYRSYPGQLGIVLVAGSGKAKKSTAIADMAEALLKEAQTCTIYDGKITPERLMTKLGIMTATTGKAVMTLVQHELTTFLSKQSYNEHMIDILTKLMDCKADGYETQQKTYLLSDVCVTQLYGTTPRNLGEGVPPQAHDTGFMGRYLWVFGDRSGKIEPLTTVDIDPQIATKSLQLRQSLLRGLREFGKLAGPFAWTQDSKDWFDNWYQKYSQSDASEGEGWPQRKPDHMLRVAMILGISAGQHNPLLIETPHMQMALKLLEEHCEKEFPKSFAFVGRHKSMDAIKHIVACFNGRPLPSNEIYHRCIKYFPDARALGMALMGLRMAGNLSCRKDGQGVEWWTLEKELY